jgi:hypothetical protein
MAVGLCYSVLSFVRWAYFYFSVGFHFHLGLIVFSRFSLGAMGKFSLAVGYGFITVGVLIAVGFVCLPHGRLGSYLPEGLRFLVPWAPCSQ